MNGTKVPSIWDAVRRESDKSSIKGNFILTGSTTLRENTKKEKINYSGIGRKGANLEKNCEIYRLAGKS